MKEIKFEEGQKIFNALGSEVRLQIVSLCLKRKEINLDELAKELFISNSAITMHVKKLEEAGIIQISHKSGVRGSQKVCSVNVDKLLISFDRENTVEKCYEYDIDIGLYNNYEVEPTCGLATAKCAIGEFDEPKYFDFLDRINASLIWFATGFLEYKIPNGLNADDKLKELQISLEIASEAPGFSSYYPSDIFFYINGVELGFWTSPGEFNNRRGLFTPSWWWENLGQYGKLKMINVNATGTYIDGKKISNVKIADLNIDSKSEIKFKIASLKNSKNVGGVTLFGKNFGDFNQGIIVKEIYE
ncbi:MAG: helix-turn-helix domain-containing protein [Clostridia bacterium]|nr:helix-turn-helix domain-containing protein [Clostridia bacterium]MBQ9513992.1 helix-turn-helix domain-containing protein [Clostridia bacterium]